MTTTLQILFTHFIKKICNKVLYVTYNVVYLSNKTNRKDMKTKRFVVQQGPVGTATTWGEVHETTEKKAIIAAVRKYRIPVSDRKYLHASEVNN